MYKRGRLTTRYGSGGFSLVEVLVAIAVAAVLMLGIASLLFSSLRLYGRGNANAEIQNESQRVLNLTMESVMEAQGLCMRIPDPGANTVALLLGDFQIEQQASNTFVAFFRGVVLGYAAASQEMLLIDLEVTDFGTVASGNYAGYCQLASGGSVEAAAAAALVAVEDFIGDMSADERLPWVMGQGVTGFSVRPALGPPGFEATAATEWVMRTPAGLTNTGDPEPPLRQVTTTFVNASIPPRVEYFYTEPLTLRVSLRLTNNTYNTSNTLPVTRDIMDDVAVRSRLKTIYVQDNAMGMQEYRHQ